MIQKPFDRVEPTDIESLIANEVRERRTLEYKLTLPTNQDEERKEFLADVSSFANAAGGDILYGIQEKRDADGKTTGIPEAAPGLAGLNADQEIRRLESMIRDGIQPRIAGIHIRMVGGFASGPVLLIRVQKSYAAPHMVVFKNLSRFFSRDSTGKRQLDVTEIRSAFALSETLPERVRRFRDDRLARIVAGETPATLHEGAKLVLHMLPFSALDPTTQLDVEQVAAQRARLKPLYAGSGGWDARYNFDGFLTFDVHRESGLCDSYVQFFRSGAIEAVDSWVIHGKGDKLFPASAVERELMTCVQHYAVAQRAVQVEPPLVVMVSLLGVRGYHILAGAFMDFRAAFDRDILLLPDILVEEWPVPVHTMLKPTFDAMWQASGWPRCCNYDDSGNRVDHQKYLNLPF